MLALVGESNNTGDTSGYTVRNSILFGGQATTDTRTRIDGVHNRAAALGGELVFNTCTTGGSLTEKGRFLANGGLTFNGDTAAANALDDYEEGTWTPTIVRSSSNPSLTYSYNHGTYVKIGRLVYYHFLMIVTAVSSNGSGNSRVAGIPYAGATSTSVYAQVGQIGYNDVWTSDVGSLFAQSDGFQIINTGVTQGNLGQNPTTGYFAGAGWYTT